MPGFHLLGDDKPAPTPAHPKADAAAEADELFSSVRNQPTEPPRLKTKDDVIAIMQRIKAERAAGKH